MRRICVNRIAFVCERIKMLIINNKNFYGNCPGFYGTVILLVALSTLSTMLASSNATISRNVKLDKSKTRVLVENGKADFVIVVSKDAFKITTFAAEELKKFMDKALNTNIAIANQVPENTPAIIVGDGKLSRQAGLDVKKLPRDGFYIKTAGENIFIVGRDNPTMESNPKSYMHRFFSERATLNGVYEFLERFVGVRFYFPGDIGTVVPRLGRLELPIIDICDSPDHTARRYYLQLSKCEWHEGIEHEKGNYLNNWRLRMATDFVPFCHGLAHLEYIERFGKTNPEYFALGADGKRLNEAARFAGQLCYTSGIRREIYNDAEAYLTGKPAIARGLKSWNVNVAYKNYFNVMPQDSYVRCRCPECARYKSDSDLVWDMTCDVAEELKNNKIPGYVTQMAYTYYKHVPERKIPDNVLVMVGTLGPWADGNAMKVQDELILDWTKKTGHKVELWNYVINWKRLALTKHSVPGGIQMTPRAIGKYYQRHAPYITGAFVEGETDFFINVYLNWYVFSKVSWDNKVDVEALLDEHFNLMFAAGAIQMKKIFEGLEDIWINKIYARSIETPLGPRPVGSTGYEIWEKFYPPEKLKEFNRLFDEAEKLTLNDPDSLKRVKFMRAHLLGQLLAASKEYFDEAHSLETWTFPVKTLAAKEKISIDGKLDDPAWQQSVESFLLPFKSDNGEVKTRVYVLKDSENLYLGFDCAEPETARIKSPERKTNDAGIWLDSCVEVHLNPSGDRKNLFQIIANASGSTYQKAFLKEGAHASGKDWSGNVVVKTNIGNERWSLEMAIPLTSLGKFKEDGFPVNFVRTRGLNGVAPKVLHYTWSPFIKRSFNEVENFGTLTFGQEKPTPVIDNGDFTQTPQNNRFGKWTFPLDDKFNKPMPGYSISIDDSTFMAGGQSLKIVSQGGSFAIQQWIGGLKPATKYNLSFYIKLNEVTTQSPRGGVGVQIYSGKKSVWWPSSFYKDTMPWTKQGFTFTTDETTKGGGIKLWVRNAQGTVWFDKISINEVD